MGALVAIAAVFVLVLLWRRESTTQSGGAPDISLGPPQQGGPGSGGGEYGGSLLSEMAQAIFNFEGNQPGEIAYDNNNPGNLKSAPGMVGTDRGFAIFGSQSDGFGALESYISRHTAANPNWDFYDFFDNYLRGSTTAPAIDQQGDSNSYAEYVANYLGVPATTPVSSVVGG